MYDYRNGDFAGLRGALEALNLCNLIQDSDDINLDWTYWKDAFMSAVSDFIPTKKIKGKNTPPWITSEIIHALRKKEAACSKLKKSPTDHQRQKYRELRTKAKILIHESREICFSSLDSDLARQPKRFWSFFKLKNKTRTFPETMSSGDDNQQGPQASTPQQIAELFNSYFVSVFTAPSEIRTLSAHFTSSHPTLNEPEIPVEMVLTSLKQLDINKATGSGRIPVRLLKETAEQISPSLIMLFNKSLRLGIFPGDWKLANIVPIFKKGKRDFVENYRPISLLPVISKVLERCILPGLRDHISHLISREQHGFLAGRSCVTQLTRVLHYIGDQLDAGKQIDIIYLDMSKTFDKVDHTKLLGRLHQYGITCKLHDWFRSYLQERKQQVTVLGATSRELPVTSGVPQGSLLGPILFLLFVDDLPNTVKTSRVACYADDTKIFKSIDSITDCNALQSDLNDLVSWSESSGLIFNQSKCKYQCITRKKSPVQPTYIINETPLESCDTEKDLGVWVSSNLTSDKQVTE